MTDTTTIEQTETEIIEQPAERLSKGDLIRRGVDAVAPEKARGVQISSAAGGLAFDSMLQVMEFAKLMAVAGVAVPPHCQGNPGVCLAITVKAVAWRMEPFAVAEKSYVVNSRVGYESQLVHAVVEARAPIQKRLNSRYAGEGPTRTCTVIGMFTDGEVREYTTPEISNIKVKNSPLWSADPDQQLWYFAVRSWARRWCPEVLLGVYTREELDANPRLGREEEPPPPSLSSRLKGSEPSGEGFQGSAHVDSELSSVAPNAAGRGVEVETPAKVAAPKPAGKAKGAPPVRSTPKAASRKPAEPEKPIQPSRRLPGEPRKAPSPAEVKAIADNAEKGKTPKTADEYVVYAESYIDRLKIDDVQARWDGERDMRDELSVKLGDRKRLQLMIDTKRSEED
jgi:hypothetical protein